MTIKRYMALLAALVAVIALSVAGVASAATKKQKAVVKQAQKELVTYAKPVKKLGLKPTKKAVPSNVTMALVTTPPAVLPTAGVKAAAAALGWKVNTTTPAPLPEAFASAVKSAVQTNPDVLMIFCPFPLSSVKADLDEAKKKGIIVVTAGASGYPVGTKSSPIVANGAAAQVFSKISTLAANIAITDAKKGPNAALVIDSQVPAWKVQIAAFNKRIKAAGGQAGIIDTPLIEIGKGAPGRIVSYLQKNPDTKYVVFNIPAYYFGVRAALISAGLDKKVKLVMSGSDKNALASVKSGEFIGAAYFESLTNGWRLVDAAARGVTKTKQQTWIDSAFLIVTPKRNSGMSGEALDAYPGRNGDFIKAWKGPKK